MPLLKPESIVIVPWDFSDHSRKALDQTLELVENTNQVRVVHVAHLPSMVGPGMLDSSLNEESLIRNSETKFRECVSDDSRFHEVSYTTLVREEQGRTICDFARDNNADLIVISSHGRTGLSRLLMGSVAERVVRYATCPVLVLR